MANQNYYTTGVMMKYADRLVTQLGFATEVNKEFLNKNQENYKKMTIQKYIESLKKLEKSLLLIIKIRRRVCQIEK